MTRTSKKGFTVTTTTVSGPVFSFEEIMAAFHAVLQSPALQACTEELTTDDIRDAEEDAGSHWEEDVNVIDLNRAFDLNYRKISRSTLAGLILKKLLAENPDRHADNGFTSCINGYMMHIYRGNLEELKIIDVAKGRPWQWMCLDQESWEALPTP